MSAQTHIVALFIVVVILFILKLLIKWRTGQFSIRAAYKSWRLVRRMRVAFKEYHKIEDWLNKFEQYAYKDDDVEFWTIGDTIVEYQKKYKDLDNGKEYGELLWNRYEKISDEVVFLGF